MYIIVAVYAKKQFYWKYIDFCCTEKKQKYRRIIVSDTESSSGTDSGGQFWSIIFDFEADELLCCN